MRILLVTYYFPPAGGPAVQRVLLVLPKLLLAEIAHGSAMDFFDCGLGRLRERGGTLGWGIEQPALRDAGHEAREVFLLFG